MGRPSVWTPALETQFFDILASGCSIKDAAISAGVDYATVKRKQQTDPNFCAKVEKSRVDFKLGSLKIIAAAATKSWQAAAWWLERTHPHEFGRRAVEVSGPGGGPIVTADVTKGGAIAAQIRDNPAAFAEHERLLAGVGARGRGAGADVAGGVRGHNDGGGKQPVDSGSVPPADKPRARRGRPGKV